ncbi:uncharacterized protein LOC131949080 isoform X2 [Physella acuta]|nr:uncharacterized protein LOC131949080 isoform X2 [Physella acuta]
MTIEGYEKECKGVTDCVYTGRIYGNIVGDFSPNKGGCIWIYLENCNKDKDCSHNSGNWFKECLFPGRCFRTGCKQISDDDHCCCEDESNPYKFRSRPEFKNSWYRLASYESLPWDHRAYNVSEKFDVSNPPVALRTNAFSASTNGKLQLQADPIIICVGAILVMFTELLNKDWI